MIKVERLDDLVRHTIKYLGSGYKYYKIVQIPFKKRTKTAQICEKIKNQYQTTLSRGKRQYKRKKGLSNYGAINYRDIIIIFRTQGENNDDKNEFKEFKKNLKLEISEWISLVFFKNEHNRLTVKLDKMTYRRIKEDFYIAIKNNQGQNYNKLKYMWKNLPRYKGIGVQGSQLHRYISTKLQEFNRNWKKLY